MRFGKSVALLLTVLSSGVYAMSIADAGKVCLFSGISGVVTLDGKPAAGARLVRTVNREKDKSDETVTDATGHFSMPPMFERTITKFLPQEFVVSQKIEVIFAGETYELWNGVKRTAEENAESRGKPLVVSCELDLEEMNYIKVNGGPIFSRCTWDVKADEKFSGSIFDED